MVIKLKMLGEIYPENKLIFSEDHYKDAQVRKLTRSAAMEAVENFTKQYMLVPTYPTDTSLSFKI